MSSITDIFFGLWTNEADGRCTQCGKVVCRTTTQSCLDWCKYARECLGEEGHQKYQEMKTRLRKDTLLAAADAHVDDAHLRRQARARVAFAEQFLLREAHGHHAQADPHVVIVAAALASVNPAAAASGDREPVTFH